MEKPFVPLIIRPSEEDFDCNNHVNNAAIDYYLEEGRLNLLQKSNLGAQRLKDEKGLAIFVFDKYIAYKKQILREMTEIVVESRFGNYVKGALIPMEQELTYKGSLLDKAITNLFYFNVNLQKPVRPPQDLLDLMVNI